VTTFAKPRAFLALAGLVLAVGTGCSVPVSSRSAALGEGGPPHITLQRGGNGSSLAIRPPYLSGRDFSLTYRNNTLFGWVSPAAARAGALRVQIEPTGASGYGPHGPVGMDILADEEATVADGYWDGRRVHLALAAAGVSGTVADVRQPAPAFGSGPIGSCEYTLDRGGFFADASGVFEGFSTCLGLAQHTRLEIPGSAITLLSRSELVTILVALLSAPPLTQAEAAGQMRVADGFDFPERDLRSGEMFLTP
jgi:hypothetical protein